MRELLRVSGITKWFPGVLALHDVALELRQGEVLAVIGENGAGKSTLMKILAGVQPADKGEIQLDGEPVDYRSVREATALGIALIHQELNLCDNLSVAENLTLGNEPHRLGWIDRARQRGHAVRTLERIGLDVGPSVSVASLSLGQKQLLEIAKALSVGSRILIMDEPTSSLSAGETEQLFAVVDELRAHGTSVIYISHRLSEVKRIADRVTVLRDGENAGDLDREQISHDAMVRLMVGRDVSQFYHRSAHEPGATILEVRGLRTRAHPERTVDFSVRANEVVGIAGLVGAGRSEFLRAIFGVDRPLAGSIRVSETELRTGEPSASIDAGVAFVPEDRKTAGLLLEAEVGENLVLCLLRKLQHAGFIDFTTATATASDLVDRLGIKTPRLSQTVRYLSGGNQQKVVLGKWLALTPSLLLLDEPTRGIDVGAKREIYDLVDELARSGVAIVFASSEMEEVLGVSDRVVVMHEGAIAGQLDRDSLSEANVMALATGAGPGAGG